ncbi:MAG: hypothetical protein JOY94_17875 [Methylobacteriaceae bacterium]|nr:hypothetical protein [Methylobacteriaceae bacterium]
MPCLPVAVNTGLFWARRSLLRRPGTVLIEFLEPIPPGLDKRRFLDLLKSRVEQATQRLIAEAIAKDPSLADVVPTEPPGAPAMTG